MGKMHFGFTVDPDLVHGLKDHVYAAFEELEGTVDGVRHRTG